MQICKCLESQKINLNPVADGMELWDVTVNTTFRFNGISEVRVQAFQDYWPISAE